MSEQPEFFTYTRDEFMDEFVCCRSFGMSMAASLPVSVCMM